eukprot:TRINITY_DN16153_c0_g1_i1.p1 TRINITY_DN16153_c0_g1~~TRINITY_DN16153_c0_g1_i1.p1  ORF type:complete len:416 (+),score=78.12 TRINITY_DN16153_c0_g1_i1:295-1542(+)
MASSSIAACINYYNPRFLSPTSKRLSLRNSSRVRPSHASRNYLKLFVKAQYPQNVDFPPDMRRIKKKPFPIPVKELRRAARLKQKRSRLHPYRPVGPPRNGLLVQNLIPIAYQVFEARRALMNGVAALLKAVPTHACRECSEVHVGRIGHPFKTCRGSTSSSRHSQHDWSDCYLEDIVLPINSYHLFDRLRKPVTQDERYSIERIPAVVELCIQAGLDLPQYLTRRRVEPVFYFGKEMFDPNEDEAIYDMKDRLSSEPMDLYEPSEEIQYDPSVAEETKIVAEKTLEAWTTMRHGVEKLMRKYAVKVCGYCPEVHVGPFGHKARLCSGYKSSQRHGRHGWQRATIDDIIPPKYVWHVPDPTGAPLVNELKRFYGKAHAVVELCIQAGATIPEEFKPTMREDVVVPVSFREANIVA